MDTLKSISRLVDGAFSHLSLPVRKNLSAICAAFLPLMSSARGGNGVISLASLFRLLPTSGSAHSRENRLRRFLDNSRLEGRAVCCGLASLVLSGSPRGFYPVLFDQTKSGSAQTLFAAVPYQGRALPLSIYTFEYPWEGEDCDSQNKLEKIFLMDIAGSVPEGFVPVFVGDRGYCKSVLFRTLLRERMWFLIRGVGGAVVEVDGVRRKLKDLTAPCGQAMRYEGVLYHAMEKVEMDVIVYHGAGNQEPWRLLTPTWTRKYWTASDVARVYGSRMRIETSFRDFKTHLGLRGLKLKVRIAERMGRLLMGFCLAYVLLVVLGASEAGEKARETLETPRAKARHGTTRTVSVLYLAMMMLSHPKHTADALKALWKIMEAMSTGGYTIHIETIAANPRSAPG